FVYVTKDGGNNWTASDNSLGLNEDAAIINSHCWYIPDPFDHTYIKYSADSGSTWTIQLTDPGGFSVLDKSRKGSTLWTGTTLGKVYKYNDNISTSVTDAYQNPEVFSLSQNYPNPFNPSTVIYYELKTGSRVTLTVSDISGREVTELFSGKQSPGSYRYDFNASNYPAGVYFYTLRADKFSQTKKMLLIK
ncbi:MAG: T9SS type A sorting domain-containing protein, partial [Ignavibacteria bacterium]|nr:T9SS type A sorting domain-containing protein [Ignavibacteria bacterium]